ncbi:winged helix-turn-helix transcriptional regulator [Subtercola lobariae]|uniref:HxlR family transcriptional regulator n=1 Tax=Subtercola lobariae TaxID=1588641 RepID=A0A917EXF1_9MICO|nr:helix-turn-helix domain-containing protein [Subtercola lobariae]GGF20440.1 HxlR family transcriptional regulator [Subtercola lobariae]
MVTSTNSRSKNEHHCSIHRSLDLVGEKWSLLIVRNALRGQTRFSEFRDSLGVPSDVLAARLASLVEAGVLERRAYREPGARERFSYHLTAEGAALKTVLIALQEWGDEFTPNAGGRVSLTRDTATGQHASLAFVGDDGAVLDPATIALVPGPAAPAAW